MIGLGVNLDASPKLGLRHSSSYYQHRSQPASTAYTDAPIEREQHPKSTYTIYDYGMGTSMGRLSGRQISKWEYKWEWEIGSSRVLKVCTVCPTHWIALYWHLWVWFNYINTIKRVSSCCFSGSHSSLPWSSEAVVHGRPIPIASLVCWILTDSIVQPECRYHPSTSPAIPLGADPTRHSQALHTLYSINSIDLDSRPMPTLIPMLIILKRV